MTDTKFTFYDKNSAVGVPVKAWDKGVEFDGNTYEQLHNIASLPFMYKHVAAMPDAHLGKGATVGSVIATRKAIVPAAVGVDIGCGMCAWKLSLKADDLPDSLSHVRAVMERAVPHGRTNNGRAPGDKGAWDEVPGSTADTWKESLEFGYNAITEKHPKAKAINNVNHLGTMGGGNHFLELCLDEHNNNVWLMLHSGSRGAGNRIGQYFISKAKEEMEKYHIAPYLEDQDCAYLVENSEVFDDYVYAVKWAQEFAKLSRELMMQNAVKALSTVLPPFTVTDEAINCHHNYITKENHFGENVWITRKGAVRARKGDLGIIPGSMGTGSFIVRGLGNEQSFCSCSHGAGRKMSRTQAKKLLTLEDHEKATAGIECRKDEGVLDESPGAYKDLSAVMAAQDDLVEIVYKLRQIVNVKG